MRINSASSNEIYITPTRIHIYNPGSLVPGTDPQMFANGSQGSMIRNPLIATVLYYNRTIDAFGTGFERVFHLCGKEKYRYSNNPFWFAFEFIRSKESINDSINDTIYENLSNLDKQIYEIMVKLNAVTEMIGSVSIITWSSTLMMIYSCRCLVICIVQTVFLCKYWIGWLPLKKELKLGLLNHS